MRGHGAGGHFGRQWRGVEQRGAVLWLTITREERRNAMSHGVLAGMAQAIGSAQGRRDVRAIVVTGAGLTTDNIAAAVWDRLIALHTDPNTMGGKLTAAEKAAKLAAILSA